MEKFLNPTSNRDQFFSTIVGSLSEELSQKLSENIERGWFSDYVNASATFGETLVEIEYHPYHTEESFLVIMKPNNNDQLQNIEKRILSQMDFCKIENDARDIYDSIESYEC